MIRYRTGAALDHSVMLATDADGRADVALQQSGSHPQTREDRSRPLALHVKQLRHWNPVEPCKLRKPRHYGLGLPRFPRNQRGMDEAQGLCRLGHGEAGIFPSRPQCGRGDRHGRFGHKGTLQAQSTCRSLDKTDV